MKKEEVFVPDCQKCGQPCFDYEKTGFCWQEQGCCPDFEPNPAGSGE